MQGITSHHYSRLIDTEIYRFIEDEVALGFRREELAHRQETLNLFLIHYTLIETLSRVGLLSERPMRRSHHLALKQSTTHAIATTPHALPHTISPCSRRYWSNNARVSFGGTGGPYIPATYRPYVCSSIGARVTARGRFNVSNSHSGISTACGLGLEMSRFRGLTLRANGSRLIWPDKELLTRDMTESFRSLLFG